MEGIWNMPVARPHPKLLVELAWAWSSGKQLRWCQREPRFRPLSQTPPHHKSGIRPIALEQKWMLILAAATAAKLLQLCLTLCDPIDGSPPGSPVPGILQARTLEWVAISFSNACKWKVKGKLLSCIWLLATPWTTAYQAPPSMGFSRQEYWSGVPLPSPC